MPQNTLKIETSRNLQAALQRIGFAAYQQQVWKRKEELHQKEALEAETMLNKIHDEERKNFKPPEKDKSQIKKEQKKSKDPFKVEVKK